MADVSTPKPGFAGTPPSMTLIEFVVAAVVVDRSVPTTLAKVLHQHDSRVRPFVPAVLPALLVVLNVEN
jgi:hypothetical protein